MFGLKLSREGIVDVFTFRVEGCTNDGLSFANCFKYVYVYLS